MQAGLVTPLDPRNGRAAPRAPAPASQQASVGWREVRLEVAAATSCGPQHCANEDAHTPLGVAGPPFVVADGVGGGAIAGLVSRWLVAELQVRLATLSDDERAAAARIGQAMLEADAEVGRRIAEVTDAPGAATVALAAPLDDRAARWIVAWVGDCRVYRWSPARRLLSPLTEDDTFRHLGEIPPRGSAPDDPARMVGNGATAGANLEVHALADGEALLLCSDGVHRCLDGADWLDALGRREDDPDGGCDGLRERVQALVRLARARGSTDDATVLMVRARRRPQGVAPSPGGGMQL
jgi:protein phosphatase